MQIGVKLNRRKVIDIELVQYAPARLKGVTWRSMEYDPIRNLDPSRCIIIGINGNPMVT